jgi:threonine dehydrogenase-like Zn-dependent dehydrogenase
VIKSNNIQANMKMRAAVCHGYRILEVIERDVPQISDGYALVQVSNCGISKMDVASYTGENPLVQLPRILGREICGKVKQLVPNQDGRIDLGTKVLVNPIISCGNCQQCLAGRQNHCENLKLIGLDLDGGFAEFVEVPIENLHPLPEDVNLERHILAFPMSMAHHMVSRIDFSDVDYILIMGSGPVGLLSGLNLMRRKDIQVDIIDTNSFRLNIARDLGLFCIDGSQNQIQNIIKRRCSPGKEGPDVIIETTGNLDFLNLAVQLVRIQGQIIVSGKGPTDASFDFLTLVEREISLTGSFMYAQEDLSHSISEISNRGIDHGTLITHRLPLEGVSEGIRILESVEETMKIIISM